MFTATVLVFDTDNNGNNSFGNFYVLTEYNVQWQLACTPKRCAPASLPLSRPHPRPHPFLSLLMAACASPLLPSPPLLHLITPPVPQAH